MSVFDQKRLCAELKCNRVEATWNVNKGFLSRETFIKAHLTHFLVYHNLTIFNGD